MDRWRGRMWWWRPGPQGVIAALLLGAAVNLAVAAGLSIRRSYAMVTWPPLGVPRPAITPAYMVGAFEPVRAVAEHSPPWTGLTIEERWMWGPDMALAEVLAVDARTEMLNMPVSYVLTTIRTGWPVRTLERDVIEVYDRAWDAAFAGKAKLEWVARAGLHAGVVVRGRGPFARWDDVDAIVLPAVPVWGGVAVGTAFWGTVLWSFVVAGRAVKRRRRAARGFCRDCGYDLRGSAACPECGGRGA